MSEEEHGNEDDDEMLFVRGASPTRKGSRSLSPAPRKAEHDGYNSGSDYDERTNRYKDDKRGGAKCNNAYFYAISTKLLLNIITALSYLCRS